MAVPATSRTSPTARSSCRSSSRPVSRAPRIAPGTEVAEGFECGILLDGFNDVKEGDVIEAFETREIERTTLDQPPAPAVSSS